MIIKRLTVGYIKTNCYIIHADDRKDCIVVDPGDEKKKIFGALEEDGLEPKAIILTHGHFDHIHEIPALKEKYPDIKVYCLDAEKELLSDMDLNGSKMFRRKDRADADALFHDGEDVSMWGLNFKVIATPGHTVGSCCFYFKDEAILISGDTLFYENVGRSDFATGDHETEIKSIKEKLFTLPDDTKVLPGHGEYTSIGHEKTNNPFANI